MTLELICRRMDVGNIRKKSIQGSENNTGKGPMEGDSEATQGAEQGPVQLELGEEGVDHREW